MNEKKVVARWMKMFSKVQFTMINVKNLHINETAQKTALKSRIVFLSNIVFKGNGQNYENQNVENQKDLRNLRRRSEHRKDKLKRSERRKANYQNVEKQIITTSKRVDHYYENHNVKKNIESHNWLKNHFWCCDLFLRHR